MTNEEIIKRIADEHSYYLDYSDFLFNETLDICKDIIKWKDQQFKEYLEQKKENIMAYPYSGHCLYDMNFIDEIINELFGETENVDHSNNDE